ncbi:hypothetical protein [Streptomyces harbinensis]|uniref:hypothetical protein n=1 Tax=Streptomyces harbinensis TaxID=1176198 RepID=UPI00368AC6E0
MTAVTMSGRVTIGDRTLRCPGTGAGMGPSRLRLVATGGAVRATCDRKHAQQGGAKASCWWVVDGLTPADLAALAEAKPGRVRAQLSNGAVLEGRVATSDGAKGKGAGKAAKKSAVTGPWAKLKAAAAPKPTAKASGKPAAPAAAKSGGGAAVAAFGALAALAGAVGQTARAGADIVGSGARVVTEGIGVVRDGIRAVDNAGARDLVRHTTQQQAQTGPATKGK